MLQQTKLLILDWVGPLHLSLTEVKRVPSGIPGIYMLHVLARDYGGYATFYVGKTSDIRRRLLQHAGKKTTKAAIRAAREIDMAYWSAAPIEDGNLIDPIESGLIRILRPVCNTQIPACKPMPVSLPPLSFRNAFHEKEYQ